MPPILGSRSASFVQKIWYPNYWLKHEFNDDVVAPVTSPYTGNATGALTILDANSKLSFSGGKALFATGGSASGNPAMYGAQQTRLGGRAAIGILSQTGQNFEFGWNSAQSGANLIDCIRFNSTGSAIRDNGTAIDIGLTLGGGPFFMQLIQRANGGFWAFIRGVGIPSWKLLWVGAASTGNLYPGAAVASTTYVGNMDAFRGTDYGYPFNDDYGFATQRLSGARSAGDFIIHEPNFMAEWIQTTLPSSGNTDIRFRVVDSNNYFQVLVSSAGLVTLNVVVAGSTTAIGTATGTVANGNRIVVSMDLTTMRTYAQSVVKPVGTNSNFTTQPNGTVSALGTGGAVSDLVTWPIYANSQMVQMLSVAGN